jgi:hypothetical protein
MGIPVLRGRDILDSDANVLLVSQDAAKLYWGADDAIERRALLPAPVEDGASSGGWHRGRRQAAEPD